MNFCSQNNNFTKTGIIGLANTILNNECPFPTNFNFLYYFDTPFFYLKDFFFTYKSGNLIYLFFSPLIFYFFLYFKFCLFCLFKENKQNPYLSLIPFVNKITMLKICQYPTYLILVLSIPFIRFFVFYKINKRFVEIRNINKSNVFWLTLCPEIFYGKLIFK